MSKANVLLKFKPATLQEGKEWLIKYYVEQPGTGQMVRKRIKVNSIKSIPERRKYAKKIIEEINRKLYDGWNPFLEESVSFGYTPLTKAIQSFLKQKEKELRPDSMRSYRSFSKKMIEWLESSKRSDILCVNFGVSESTEFMNMLYNLDSISSKTWNNYLLFFQSFWNWMIENQYAVNNAFKHFSKKAKTQKTRTIIPVHIREQIREHLQETDYNFMVVSMLVFHCLLRPKEISLLKPENFLIHKQVIRVPGEVSKNRTERLATIPDVMMPYIVAWDFNKAKTGDFIFGTDMKCGSQPICPRRFSKKWDRVREKFNLPMEYKLYSLRDSGIVQLLQDGVSPEEVMIHADHSSLEITSIYVKHAKPNGSTMIKRTASEF